MAVNASEVPIPQPTASKNLVESLSEVAVDIAAVGEAADLALAARQAAELLQCANRLTLLPLPSVSLVVDPSYRTFLSEPSSPLGPVHWPTLDDQGGLAIRGLAADRLSGRMQPNARPSPPPAEWEGLDPRVGSTFGPIAAASYFLLVEPAGAVAWDRDFVESNIAIVPEASSLMLLCLASLIAVVPLLGVLSRRSPVQTHVRAA